MNLLIVFESGKIGMKCEWCRMHANSHDIRVVLPWRWAGIFTTSLIGSYYSCTIGGSYSYAALLAAIIVTTTVIIVIADAWNVKSKRFGMCLELGIQAPRILKNGKSAIKHRWN